MKQVKEILLQQMEQLQEVSKIGINNNNDDYRRTAAYIAGAIADLATAYARLIGR